MPRSRSSSTDFPSVVHLWVTQGKTDHMARLDDPAVYALLQQQNGSMSSIYFSDILGPDAEVTIRWDTTNGRERVVASMVRVRNMENEGRRANRTRIRPELLNPTGDPSNETKTKRPKRRRSSGGRTTTVKAEGLDNIETAEAYKSSTESAATYGTSKKSRSHETKHLQPPSQKSREDDDAEASHGRGKVLSKRFQALDKEERQRQLERRSLRNRLQSARQLEIRHIADLLDEEFDSSDDEAIVHRMKLERKRDELIALDNSNHSTDDNRKNKAKHRGSTRIIPDDHRTKDDNKDSLPRRKKSREHSPSTDTSRKLNGVATTQPPKMGKTNSNKNTPANKMIPNTKYWNKLKRKFAFARDA